MSLASSIAPIINSRNMIRDKMISLGLADDNDTLNDLAVKLETMENNGAVHAEIHEGGVYVIPAGYHNGSGTVTCPIDDIADDSDVEEVIDNIWSN